MQLSIKKIFLATTIISTINLNVQAQNSADVLRYSILTQTSTARAQSLGGAMGSIGADFAGLTVNPATLGRYTKNEFTFTLGNKQLATNANFAGNKINTATSRTSLDNVGLVFAARKNEKSKWRTSSIALGMNTLQNFGRNYTFGGNNTNSITNYWAAYANANGGFSSLVNGTGNSEIIKAFNTGLLDTVGGTNNLQSIMPNGLSIAQSKITKQKGYAKEIEIAIAGNRLDKCLYGISFGIPMVSYTATTDITETDNTGNTSNYFQNLSRKDYVRTNGGGINVKAGVVFMVSDFVRIGGSLTSPTSLSLTDVYQTSLYANTENAFGVAQINSDTIISEYSITTPAKALVSGSYLFGKNGFVTADAEWVNYKGAKIGFAGDDAEYAKQVNNGIRQDIKAAVNLRIGAEYRISNFSIRGGFAHYGSAAKSAQSTYGAITRYSGGVGYRAKQFFIDGAMVLSKQKNFENIYTYTSNNTTATNNLNDVFATLTIGWKFAPSNRF